MKTPSLKAKYFMIAYMFFMTLHIIGYISNNIFLRNTGLMISSFILCCVAFYVLKIAPAFHRLLFWIALFIWTDFLGGLLFMLNLNRSFPSEVWIFFILDLVYICPSLILFIICLEVLYLIRERLNTKFLLINLFGIAFFFAVMVSGIIFYRFTPTLVRQLSYTSTISYVLDLLSLVFMIAILSSLINSRLEHSIFLILVGIALFCVVGLFFLVNDILQLGENFFLIWAIISTCIPLFWIHTLLSSVKNLGHLISHSIHQEIKGLEPIALSRTKTHSLLFILSFLCLFLDLVNFAIFSYMNLALLLYFQVSNSYLIAYQNKQYIKKQKELHSDLEEKVKQRNIAILKQNIKLQDLANRDLLTSAFNRRYFQEVIVGLTENASLFAVDILQFSNINQVFGEMIGDSVLAHLYKVLHHAFPSQAIFRVDSNEYVILFRDSQDNKEEICHRIFEAVKMPFISEFYTIPLDICIGVADYCATCTDDKPENLLTKANFALNEVKSSQLIPPVQIFDQTLADKKYRYSLIQSLLDSINYDEEFQLYFQPQYTADGSEVIGAEALLRWFNPKLGNVSPAEFIPIAEESTTIIKIVDWTLQKAVEQISEWNTKYERQLKIGINISPKYIERPNFYSNIEKLMKSSQLNTHWIDLEITETSLMHLDISVINLFKKLSAIGVSTSIDDFGTGYSSLSYIKNLKISTLKIAKELIDNLRLDSNEELIVNAIIKMAQGLHIKTIAEGVETRDQLHSLRKLGCDYIQGYYFGRPVPPDEFVKMHL